METTPSKDRPITPVERREILSLEMTVLRQLLGRPLFEDRTPNAFERLREFRGQINVFLNEMQQLSFEQAAALEGLENRWGRWKMNLYEYLNAKLAP
jgi:hypothetical protein